jgi:nicotinamide-nucleotide adenylyltransferase
MRTVLLIGRFQPFHNGHLEAVKYALKQADRLIIVVGSAQKSHELQNPFTAGERIEMIWRALKRMGLADRVLLIPVPDVENHNLWVPLVNSLVPEYSTVFSNDPLTLQLFREQKIDAREVPLKNRTILMATEVRRRIIADEDWEELVPEEVAIFIRDIDGIERLKMLNRYNMASKRDSRQLA